MIPSRYCSSYMLHYTTFLQLTMPLCHHAKRLRHGGLTSKHELTQKHTYTMYVQMHTYTRIRNHHQYQPEVWRDVASRV